MIFFISSILVWHDFSYHLFIYVPRDIRHSDARGTDDFCQLQN